MPGACCFGFDEFGNFSNPNEIQGQQLDLFSFPGAKSRPENGVHSVRISISPETMVAIDWKQSPSAEWKTVLPEFRCILSCPEQIKFGFTGSTRAVTNYHQIRNLKVTSSVVPEPASLIVWAGRMHGLL